MKKLSAALLLIFLIGCTPDEVEEKVVDCNCNEIVTIQTRNIIESGAKTTYYKYTTVNKCTGLQYVSGWEYLVFYKGQCK